MIPAPDSQEAAAERRARIQEAEKLADELIVQADRERARELCDVFDQAGGEFPPTYCLAVASLAAHAMARSSDPKLLRVALLMMIDRQFADADFMRQCEEAAGEIEATLANKEPAGNA